MAFCLISLDGFNARAYIYSLHPCCIHMYICMFRFLVRLDTRLQKRRRVQPFASGGVQDPLPEWPAAAAAPIAAGGVHDAGHPVEDLRGEAGNELQRPVHRRPCHVPVTVPDAVQSHLAERLHPAHREHPDLRL